MIREYQSADLDQIMAIWLQGNKHAHSFIDQQFFTSNYEMVKTLLPMSTIYLQDLEGIKGFIGLSDNYIAGLFVDTDYQRQGIGHALIEKAKQLHRELSVHVYVKNKTAVSFYLAQGFQIVSEQLNEETHETEYLMQCQTQRNIKIGKCAL